MKIRVCNTPHGLVPLYDEDFDEKKRLRLGQIYTAEIRLERNWRFHQKFFALLNAGFAYLPERTQNGFRTVEGFRQYVTVAAGYYDLYFNPRLSQFVETPKSIKFSAMDDAEFSKLYDAVKDVIFSMIGSRVTEDEFERNLANF